MKVGTIEDSNSDSKKRRGILCIGKVFIPSSIDSMNDYEYII